MRAALTRRYKWVSVLASRSSLNHGEAALVVANDHLVFSKRELFILKHYLERVNTSRKRESIEKGFTHATTKHFGTITFIKFIIFCFVYGDNAGV